MKKAHALVLLAAATMVLAACAATSKDVAGTAIGDDSATVTETVTETDTPSSEPETTESAPEPTDDLPQPTADDEPTDQPVDPNDPDGPPPPEATNPPTADDACLTEDLDVGLAEEGGAAGSVIYRLTFTNTATGPCTLQGFPQVMYVRGDKGIQVGAPAARDGDVAPAVTLFPGNTATAMLQEVNVYNFDESDCDPVKVRGLRVYPPGQDKAAFVPQKGAVGCRATDLPGGQFQMSVQSVTDE